MKTLIQKILKLFLLTFLLNAAYQKNVQAMDYAHQAANFVANHKKKFGAGATIMTMAMAYAAATYGIPYEKIQSILFPTMTTFDLIPLASVVYIIILVLNRLQQIHHAPINPADLVPSGG